VKDVVKSLYDNLIRFASSKGTASNAVFRELFPPMDILDQVQIAVLEERFGVEIHTTSLYEQALIHRSYLQVANTPHNRSNERLEFLGDSILGMVTAEYLFYNNRDVLEGELTKMRSWIVNKNSLAICAKALKLEEVLFLSYSAKQSLEKGNDGMLADALEAVIAAVYLDRGFDEVRRFIVEKLLPIMVKESLVHDTNYKSLLLEEVQGRGLGSPKYIVVNEEGPDHEKQFTVEVFVDDKSLGVGTGKNKKEAEQQAAEKALKVSTTKRRTKGNPQSET